MTLCFSCGFACKFVDVYTIRTTEPKQTGIAFGIVITFAGLGRFLGTLIQPTLIQNEFQHFAPLIMIGSMVIFAVTLSFIKNDKEHTAMEELQESKIVPQSIKDFFGNLIHKYQDTFYRGSRFIQRCRQFPLIPLSISFFEGIFFGSLWFIIPLYIKQTPTYVSTGLEIGIYEIISLCIAVLM